MLFSADRGDQTYRRVRRLFALSLGLTALGMLVADVPDVLHRSIGPLGSLPDACYVIGASIAMVNMALALFARLDHDARWTQFFDRLLIMAASAAFVLAYS
jgi:hypothetical protein